MKDGNYITRMDFTAETRLTNIQILIFYTLNFQCFFETF